jgi:hypothetical protein
MNKGCRRLNMGKCYVLMYKNRKMRPVGSIPELSGGEK